MTDDVQYRVVVTYGQEPTRTHWYRVDEVRDEFGSANYPEEAISILTDQAIERAARKADPRARDLRPRPSGDRPQWATLAAPREDGPPDTWGPRRRLTVEVENRVLAQSHNAHD